MATLTFEDLRFHEQRNKLKVVFKKHFHFFITHTELDGIGKWTVDDTSSISFFCPEKRAEKHFHALISQKITVHLFSNRGNKAHYVHHGPLIGGQRFGILESDSSVVEVRPMTTCNLNCNYCSIKEGIHCKQTDYYVNLDHMINECKKLLSKKKNSVTIRVCSHGEPLLYPELEELVRQLKEIPKVSFVTLGTNGTLLTEKKIIALKKAGLDQIGLSLNAFDQGVAELIAGCNYNVERMKKICELIVKHMDLIIAPVFLPGLNDDQIEKLIVFAKRIGATVGVQNFLPYKGGRNPVKGINMDDFYALLEKWERQYDISLVKPDIGFSFSQDKCLGKPFKKGDSVRLIGAMGEFGIAKERLIKLQSPNKRKVTLVRDKHNIYVGC